jgi:hypothetical protein
MLSKPPAGAATGALPPDTTVDPAVDRMGGQARRWPILAMAGTGAALLTWYGYGQLRSPIPFGFFSHPPLYGIFEPTIDPLALLVVPAALLLAAVAWAVTSSMRVRTGLALALIVAAGLIVAMAGELVRGDWHEMVRSLDTSRASPHYAADLHFVDEYGVRGFAERQPELIDNFRSYHSRTHPPGVLIVLKGLVELVGPGHSLRIATVLAVAGLAAAVAAWAVGVMLGGQRAGRIAAVLFVAAPGPLLMAYVSMDLVFAMLMAGAAALFMVAIHRRSALLAAAAGVVLGLGTLLTFATVFIAAAGTIAILLQVPGLRARLYLLGAAGAAGLATLALAWVGLSIDVYASWRAVPVATTAYDPYWIVGSPAAVLMWAGLPIAALGVAGLALRQAGARRPVLISILCGIMVVWAALPASITDLRPGEVERTWAFLYPMLAASAGVVVDRWTRDAGRWRGAIVAALVVLSVAQMVLLRSLWDNFM